MDYYNILGVNRNASQEELKKAYKKLVMEHHPDRGGDHDHFAKINEAYETLKDPAKRSAYDNPQPQFNFRSGNANDLHDIFSQFFGQHTIVRRNKDIRLSVTLTLEDVAVGKEILGSYTMPSGRTETSNFKIPAGVEHGEVIKFKGLGDDSHPNLDRGDLLVQVRVANHNRYQRDGSNIFIK
jgi:DnaJ-class molecular chaperone